MSPIPLLGLFAVAALLVAGAVRWPRVPLMSVPLFTILNGVGLPAFGRSVHLDQLAACALLVPLVAAALVGARRIRMDGTVWWLAAILLMNVVSSVLNSPTLGYSLAQCANLASIWVIYFLLLNWLDTRAALEAFVRRVLWAAVAASAIGIAAYLFAVAGLPVGGAEVSAAAAEHLTNAYGAFGTMVEPNIFGSFTGAHLVLATALLLAATRVGVNGASSTSGTDRTLLRRVVAITALGLIFSFTRAAWLAAAVCLAGVFFAASWVFGERVRVRRFGLPAGVGLLVVMVLLLLPGNAGAFFQFKLLNLVNFGSSTAVLRLVTYTLALQQTLVHPFVGCGTFTFAPLTAQGADFQQFDNWRNLWIGNYLLLALHDTGIIGLGIWFGLIVSILRRPVVMLRVFRATDRRQALTVIGLTGAVVVLLVAFLATSGFSLGYSWMLIGLLGAYCRVWRDEQTAPSVVEGRDAPPDVSGENSAVAGLS